MLYSAHKLSLLKTDIKPISSSLDIRLYFFIFKNIRTVKIKNLFEIILCPTALIRIWFLNNQIHQPLSTLETSLGTKQNLS